MLIRQHEHGRISGEFARHWHREPSPKSPTLFAIANHDIGWQELDEEVRFNPETGEPYSFMDYPLEPKLQAYKRGLDLLEAQEPYASYLCSLHYSSFVRGSSEPVAIEFREGEVGRRERLEGSLPEEWLEEAEYNFRLLQLCDDFSLFVCLNEPGENTFPWYKDGFGFMEQKLQPIWEDEQTLSMAPKPFANPFDLTIPYSRIGPEGRYVGEDAFYIRVV